MNRILVGFLHIPKTAGETVRSIISQNYHPEEIFHIKKSADFRKPFGFWKNNNIHFVHGHFNYNFFNTIDCRIFKIVFLRHPVYRVVSNYAFLRSKRAMASIHLNPNAFIRIGLANKFSLEKFIHINHPIINHLTNNFQTQFLVPELKKQIAENQCGIYRESIDIAKARLRKFDIVGIAEMIRESIAMMNHTLSWCPIDEIPFLNTTRYKEQEREIPSSVKEYLLESNPIDLELWEFSRKLVRENSNKIQYENLVATFEKKFRGNVSYDQSHCDFSGPIVGSGWYEQESDGELIWRWTGPGDRAFIYMRVIEEGNRALKVSIPHIMRYESLSEMSIRVNGYNILTNYSMANKQGWTVEGFVPWSILKNHGFAKIEFCNVKPIIPKEVYHSNYDKRPLGIALSKVVLEKL